MGSQIRVSVRMSPDFDNVIKTLPQVKGALSKEAGAIAARANGMATEKSGVWHETGKPHTPGREGGTWHDHGEAYPTVGGAEPSYGSKPAMMGAEGPIAIVFTANHAAQKDNTKNNTLLKAKG